MNFHLSKWHSVAPHLHTAQHWHDWAHEIHPPTPLSDALPELPFLPAMQRRRLSLSARLMFQAAYEVVGKQPCPTVFVSHDGELNRSLGLWQTLLRENSVSPTSFGLSVHNALVGQWGIWRGDTSENTALAAQYDGWELAISEAVALLHEGAKQVLVLAVDEPLMQPEIIAARAPFPYAVAALLEQGETCCLSRQHNHHIDSNHTGEYWGALNWVKQMIVQNQNFTQSYPTGTWQWQITP